MNKKQISEEQYTTEEQKKRWLKKKMELMYRRDPIIRQIALNIAIHKYLKNNE